MDGLHKRFSVRRRCGNGQHRDGAPTRRTGLVSSGDDGPGTHQGVPGVEELVYCADCGMLLRGRVVERQGRPV